jgi:hypothetical protein
MLLVQLGINSTRDVWKFAKSILIIYMTKLLQSDWLRGVQLFH